MILPLPEKFDANEYITLTTIIFFGIIAILLPRRFPIIFTVLVYLEVTVLAKFSDYLLSAGLPFDFYDYSDTPKLDLFDELLQLLVYPITGYLFMYVYDIWVEKGYANVLFVLFSTVISLGLEGTFLVTHAYTYKGWSMIYSIPSYLILMTTYMTLYHLKRKWITYPLETNRTRLF